MRPVSSIFTRLMKIFLRFGSQLIFDAPEVVKNGIGNHLFIDCTGSVKTSIAKRSVVLEGMRPICMPIPAGHRREACVVRLDTLVLCYTKSPVVVDVWFSTFHYCSEHSNDRRI